jgi:hypothetical protein
VNSKQRRKARRQGRNIPYYDGFNSHEERMAAYQKFMQTKREKWQKEQSEINKALFADKMKKS